MQQIIDYYNFWTANLLWVELKKRHKDGENEKMMSEGFYLILWKKRVSLIGSKLHSEHIINHSIITAHQSILMPAVIINSVGDNPSMGSLLSTGIWWSLDLNCIRAPVYLLRLSFSFSEAQGVVNIRCNFFRMTALADKERNGSVSLDQRKWLQYRTCKRIDTQQKIHTQNHSHREESIGPSHRAILKR